MARFVLVAGAWHGSWHWDLLVPMLEHLGHRVEAVELRGMGADTTPLGKVDLAMWTDAVVAALRSDPEPAILLGHSRGGFVVSEAAEAAPEAIALSVYLCALMPSDGETVTDLQLLVPRSAPSGLSYQLSADGLGIVANQGLLDRAYSKSPPEQIERAAKLVTPEPRFVAGCKASLSGARYGTVPRAYIECVHDEVVPLTLQQAMQLRQPCVHVRQLDTDHCPAASNPRLLATTLDELPQRHAHN